MKKMICLILLIMVSFIYTGCVAIIVDKGEGKGYESGVHFGSWSSNDISNSRIVGNGEFEVKSYEVENFKGLSLQSSLPAKIVYGEKCELKIAADSNILEVLEVEVSDEVLVINQEKNIKKNKNFEIMITMPSINKIKMRGAGDANLTGFQESDPLEIVIVGSSDLKADFGFREKITARVSGSGDIVLNGSTDELLFKCSGSGDINALDCEAKIVSVSCNGSGSAKVNATETLDISVSGSGSVKYKGGANIRKLNVSGSGGVKKLD